MDENELYDLAELFKVFGDSTRIRILYELMQDEQSVGSLAEKLSMTVSAISHQLSILKRSRLVRIRKDGKSRLYSLDDEHVAIIISMGLEHLEH